MSKIYQLNISITKKDTKKKTRERYQSISKEEKKQIYGRE